MENLELITTRNIWLKANISTILFLKLFDNTKEIETISGNLYYPLIYICYEYGLINCYIDPTHRSLHLLFKKVEDRNLVRSSYVTLYDRLIDSKYFHSITNYNNILLKIELKFPKIYLEDILHISQTSKYSEVSENFKKKSVIEYTSVPLIQNSIAKYIVRNQLAINILNKKPSLKNKILKELKNDEIHLIEYCPSFSNKEYWNESLIENYM